MSVVCEPLQLCGLECRTTARIGIAHFPADGSDGETLTKNADMAMYRAKEEGKNGDRFVPPPGGRRRSSVWCEAHLRQRWSSTSSRCTTSPKWMQRPPDRRRGAAALDIRNSGPCADEIHPAR